VNHHRAQPAAAGDCGLGITVSLFVFPSGGRPLRDVPQCLVDAATQAEPNFGVNALDPDFEIPKNWKVNLGTVWNFGDGYTLNADLLYTEADDSAILVGSTMEQTSTAPDGRPVYTDSRAFNTDYILTNVTGPDAESWQASISLAKSYDNGFDWSVGYAYTDAKDVNPMTSSVAFSNYANVSVDDPNGPSLANSNYNIPQRFTFSMGYSAYWWDDNRQLHRWSARSARPAVLLHLRGVTTATPSAISSATATCYSCRTADRPARNLCRYLRYRGVLRFRRSQRPEQVRARHRPAQRLQQRLVDLVRSAHRAGIPRFHGWRQVRGFHHHQELLQPAERRMVRAA
jgi:hypothetical protein